MENNDILRRVRFAFDLSDSQMIEMFKLADYNVTRAEISDWLKKDEDPAFQQMNDSKLALFLNGFIIDKRGKKEGPTPRANAPTKALAKSATDQRELTNTFENKKLGE